MSGAILDEEKRLESSSTPHVVRAHLLTCAATAQPGMVLGVAKWGSRWVRKEPTRSGFCAKSTERSALVSKIWLFGRLKYLHRYTQTVVHRTSQTVCAEAVSVPRCLSLQGFFGNTVIFAVRTHLISKRFNFFHPNFLEVAPVAH